MIGVPGTSLGISVATDGNARYVLLDPFVGGMAAVAEAARNVACTGAKPRGVTNCLNFGNPEKPGIAYQFQHACRGMGEACRVLGTPVTGGNVSFYNESPSGAVPPTLVVGMVGVLDDVRRARRAHFAQTGDTIILLGTTQGHLGGSCYWTEVLGTLGGAPPPVDLEAERRLIDLLVELAVREITSSAHDLSDGGLGVAVAEACVGNAYQEVGCGAFLDLRDLQAHVPTDALLFGEDHGRALLSAPPEHRDAVLALADEYRVPAAAIGEVTEPDGTLEIMLRNAILRVPISELRRTYHAALPRRVEVAA